MEIPEPRLATTLCVLTGGTGALRVLMVRRAATMRFMPGAWVFPGGVIEPGDDREDAGLVERVDPEHRAWVVAGAREALEEAGIWLSHPPVVVPAAERTGDVATRVAAAHGPVDGSAVHHLSTWITPTVVPVRFHTRFWVTGIDDPVAGEPDGTEVDEVDWVDPADVDDMVLPLPTRRTLTGFASLGSAAAVLDHARASQPVVYQPRLRLGGDSTTLVALLPGDDGYDAAPDLPPDPDLLRRAVDVRGVDGRPVPEMAPPRSGS